MKSIFFFFCLANAANINFLRIIYSVDFNIDLMYCSNDYPFPGKYKVIEPITSSPISGSPANFQMNIVEAALAMTTIDAEPIRWAELANGTLNQPCYLANMHQIAQEGMEYLVNVMVSKISGARKRLFFLSNVVDLVWFEIYPQNGITRVHYIDVLRRFAVMDLALSMGLIHEYFALLDNCDEYVSYHDLKITGLPFVHYTNVTIGIPPKQITLQQMRTILQGNDTELILQSMDDFRQALMTYYLETH